MYIQIYIKCIAWTGILNPGRYFQFVDDEGTNFYRSEIRKVFKLDFYK